MPHIKVKEFQGTQHTHQISPRFPLCLTNCPSNTHYLSSNSQCKTLASNSLKNERLSFQLWMISFLSQSEIFSLPQTALGQLELPQLSLDIEKKVYLTLLLQIKTNNAHLDKLALYTDCQILQVALFRVVFETLHNLSVRF